MTQTPISRAGPRRVGVAFALALAAIAPVSAEPAGPALSLTQATRLAALRAPAVAAGREQEEAARADLDRAGRLPDPRLDVGVQNLPVQGSTAWSVTADPTTMRYVGISQDLPSPSALAADRAGAAAQRLGAEAQVQQAALEARRGAAAAWIALWSARLAQAQLAELADQTRLAVDAARARLAAGRGGATDVLAAQAAGVGIDNRIDAARGDEEAALAALRRWTGDADATVVLADPPDFSRLAVPESRLLSQPDMQGPMLGWSARLGAAQAALDRADATLSPDWSVGASYGVRGPGLPAMASFQVGVRLPLFAAHREDRDVDARRAELRALRDQHDDARRAQVQAVGETLARWRSLDAQARRDRQDLLPLASDRTATALAAYRGGGELQGWLDAQRAEIEVRLDWIATLQARARAWAELAYLIPESTP